MKNKLISLVFVLAFSIGEHAFATEETYIEQFANSSLWTKCCGFLLGLAKDYSECPNYQPDFRNSLPKGEIKDAALYSACVIAQIALQLPKTIPQKISKNFEEVKLSSSLSTLQISPVVAKSPTLPCGGPSVIVDSSDFSQFSVLDGIKARLKEEDSSLNQKAFESLALSEIEREELYSYAYSVSSPYVYKPAVEVVPFENYSLNFLWIHDKKIDPAAEFLVGDDANGFMPRIGSTLMNWAHLQRKAFIYLWYDGERVSPYTVESTQRFIHKDLGLSNVFLRNVREISFIKEFPLIFDESVFIYYRVDLAKALISDYVLDHDKKFYVVTLDLDVEAVSREHLFDYFTLENLKILGIAMGRKVRVAYHENSFLMLSKETFEKHRSIVVEEQFRKFKDGLPIEQESVYSRYATLRIAIKNLNKEYVDEHDRVYQRPGTNKAMNFPKSRFSSSVPSIDGKYFHKVEKEGKDYIELCDKFGNPLNL